MELLKTTEQSAAVSLADYTHPSLIFPRLRERDTPGVINELSRGLQRHGSVPDMLPFYHAALNHELLVNSALESELAFPHARLAGIKRLQFSFGRTPEPIIWGAGRAWPVQLVFLLAVPATDTSGYLHVLASLARLGQQSSVLDHLRNGTSAAAIFSVLKQVKLRCG